MIRLTFGLIFFASLACAEPKVALLVRSSSDVSGPNITLGEISTVRVATDMENDFARKLAAVELGVSPALNTNLVLDGEDVLSKIKAAGFSESEFVYAIPNKLTVNRPAKLLNAALLREPLSAALRAKFGSDIELKRVSLDGHHMLDEGEVSFNFAFSEKPRGGGELPVIVSVTQESTKQITAKAYVRHFRLTPVLSSSVKRGETLPADAVEMLKLDLTDMPRDILFDREEVIGLRAVKNLSPGQPIRRNQLDIPPLVSKGQEVMMKFVLGTLEVTGKGRAMEDGRREDVIKLRNTDSRQMVNARIVAPDLVEVIP